MGLVPFPPDTRLTLHPLVVRRHGSEFIVGRTETGIFVSIPPTGLRILQALQDGQALQEVETLLAADGDASLDVAAFSADLADLGFVDAVNDQPAPPAELTPDPLPRIAPHQARRFFSWPATLLWTGLLTAATATLVRQPELLPAPTAFFWSTALSMVIAVNLVFWLLHRTMHEIAHITAARAEGIPFQLRPGRRTRFLRLHADVSGAWALPRGARYRIYGAGLAWDLALASAFVLALAYAPLPPSVHALLEAWLLLAVLAVIGELRFFGRADVHQIALDRFPVQDLLGEVRRRLAGGRPATTPDSGSPGLLPYAVAFLLSAPLVIAAAVAYVVPIVSLGVERALGHLGAGLSTGDPSLILDGGFALVVGAAGLALAIDALLQRRRSAPPANTTIRRQFRASSTTLPSPPAREGPAQVAHPRP